MAVCCASCGFSGAAAVVAGAFSFEAAAKGNALKASRQKDASVLAHAMERRLNQIHGEIQLRLCNLQTVQRRYSQHESWCKSFDRLGWIKHINARRFSGLLALSNIFQISQSSKNSRASTYYAVLRSRNQTELLYCYECPKFEESGAVSMSTGNPVPVANMQGAAQPWTRTITIMIDGVNKDSHLERFQCQLKEIGGVFDVLIGPFMEGGIRGGYVTVDLHVKSDVTSVSLIRDIQALGGDLLILPYRLHSWLWRGHRISYAVAGCGRPIILVHGFGGNSGHFAKLIPYLVDHYRVYALDLLGFGASDKPVDANYGPELWAEIILEFSKEFAQEGAVLVGNSIGSLSALTAATMGGSGMFRGLVLLNCAGAMNRKGLTQDDPLIRIFSPIFAAVEYLLQRPWIATFLFDRFRRKENVRKILMEQAYKNKESVTDQLVDILHYPSTLPGAKDVFVKVFTGDPGPRPEALMKGISMPLLVLWGDSDRWTPVNGSVAEYFMKLAKERDNISVYALPDVGHCPHDDRPELAADYILPFLSSINW
eukprot:c27699_g1_i1 orf=143-1762(+)